MGTEDSHLDADLNFRVADFGFSSGYQAGYFLEQFPSCCPRTHRVKHTMAQWWVQRAWESVYTWLLAPCLLLEKCWELWV